MTHPQDTTPANPAQGDNERTLADVVATIEAGEFYQNYDQSVADLRILRAAIGAGGQAVAVPSQRGMNEAFYVDVCQAEDRLKEFIETARRLLDSLPEHWHGEAETELRDLCDETHAILNPHMHTAYEVEQAAKRYGRAALKAAPNQIDLTILDQAAVALSDMNRIEYGNAVIAAAVELSELRAALTHPAPSGQAVAVEALEWREGDDTDDSTAIGTVNAQTPFGKYVCSDGGWFLWANGTRWVEASHQSAAQAAAQADYERRIMSAIAHPVQPGWRLVPEEPTLAMQNAGWREAERQGIDINEVELAPIYRAMLSAAPQPKGEA